MKGLFGHILQSVSWMNVIFFIIASVFAQSVQLALHFTMFALAYTKAAITKIFYTNSASNDYFYVLGIARIDEPTENDRPNTQFLSALQHL